MCVCVYARAFSERDRERLVWQLDGDRGEDEDDDEKRKEHRSSKGDRGL